MFGLIQVIERLASRVATLNSIPKQLAILIHNIADMRYQLTTMENKMSAATDALNKAVSDLSSVSDAMLTKISEEAAKIDELLKTDDTPEVDAATARISAMASELKDKLGALNTSAAAVATDATPTPTTGNTVATDTAPVAHTPLEGVPATPESVAAPAATGPAIPNTDHVLTDTSVNPDTSSTPLAPGAEGLASVPEATPSPVPAEAAAGPIDPPKGDTAPSEDAPASVPTETPVVITPVDETPDTSRSSRRSK